MYVKESPLNMLHDIRRETLQQLKWKQSFEILLRGTLIPKMFHAPNSCQLM